MSTDRTVDILLATWNGERYLTAQVDSIIAQTFDDWRLVARDDGSSDGTVEILRAYAARHPGRIVLLEDSDNGLGACGNFGRLMEHVVADYVMFCDQDDIWLPDKIATLVAAMHELEAGCGKDTPLLVHSDLRVVGDDLRTISPSFWSYQSLDPAFARSVGPLMGQNVVTGCASLCNRCLIELSLPLPPGAVMHDWWIALVAAALGEIRTLPQATVLYRQHDSNTLGAKRLSAAAMLGRVLVGPVGAIARTRQTLLATQRQAAALLDRFGESMDDDRRKGVARYATLSRQGFVERRFIAIRQSTLPSGLIRKLIFLAAI